jgi:hypothetical protein
MSEPTASDPTGPVRDLVVRCQLAAPVPAVWRAFTEVPSQHRTHPDRAGHTVLTSTTLFPES